MLAKVALFLVVALTGCQAVTRPGVAIGPSGPVKPGQYVGGIAPPMLLSGMAKDVRDTNKQQKNNGTDLPYRSDPFGDFQLAYDASLNDWENKDLAEQMMLSGFTFGELLCDRYFNVLANDNQDIGFGIEGASIASGLSAAVLGLTKSPAKSIALVSTGFSATIAGMEAFQQNYYFGPDVSVVRDFIMNGMQSYRLSILDTDTSQLNHYSAINHIRAMQSICQVDSIKHFVDDAVSKQKIQFSTTGREDFLEQISLVQRRNLNSQLRTTQPLTNEDLVFLYMLTTGGTSVDFNKKVDERFETIGLGAMIESNGKLATTKPGTDQLDLAANLLDALPRANLATIRQKGNQTAADFESSLALEKAKAGGGQPDAIEPNLPIVDTGLSAQVVSKELE